MDQILIDTSLGPVTWTVVLEAMFLLLSVVGQELNVRQNVQGFAFWLASNMVGIVMFAMQSRWLMVGVYIYFAINCVRGFIRWRHLASLRQAAQFAGRPREAT